MGKLKLNLLYNMMYQILILIVPLVTTPYVSRVLMPEGVGIYSVTTAIAKYFWLFALLGMMNYGNRAISKVRDNKHQLSEEFWNLFSFQALISSISFFVYIIYSMTLGKKIYGVVAICQIPYVLAALFEISWFFYGLEEFRFMVIRNAMIKIITAISIFSFVRNESDIWIYILINALSLLIGQLCLWPFLLKHIKFVRPKWKLVKCHFRPNMILFVSVVAVSIYTLVDKIMLQGMSSIIQVGYYENTEKIMTIANSLVGAIGAVMLPRISYLMEKQEKEKISIYMKKSMKYIMILALGIAFGIAGISMEFSIVFFGEKFSKTGLLLIGISPAIVFYSWENILRTQYLLPGNRDRIFVMGTVYAAVANVLVNLILISRIGAMGAVIGTVCAQFMAASYQSLKVRKELPIREYLFNLIPFCVIGFFMFIICRIIGVFLGCSILTIVTQIIVGSMFYCSLSYYYLILRRDELAIMIRNQIASLIK